MATQIAMMAARPARLVGRSRLMASARNSAMRSQETSRIARMIPAGTMKLFAFPAGMPPDGSTAPMMSQIWAGGILEVFGGALLLIGLFTRPVAFVLSGMLAVAYWQFHAPGGFWPTMNGGVPAVLYCFVLLYISAAGAGPLSLDGLRGK